jgi:diguanylate cyclase (GGDEF)-like protein
LRLWSRRALWSRDAIRRVTTLAVLAAAAEEHACVLRHELPGVHDTQSGAHSLPYFTACLTHALALSRRRGVPLSLICIQIDPVRDGEPPPPDGITAATLHHLTRAMTASLRSSDVIARIADQQLAALLPDTSMANAGHVAVTLRRVLSEAWLTTGAIPGLCATLGIASYPDAAHEPGPLLAAAREALARAQANGPGRIACASPRARPHESAILAGCR